MVKQVQNKFKKVGMSDNVKDVVDTYTEMYIKRQKMLMEELRQIVASPEASFMKSCRKVSTTFEKCALCEFRFSCYTEVNDESST